MSARRTPFTHHATGLALLDSRQVSQDGRASDILLPAYEDLDPFLCSHYSGEKDRTSSKALEQNGNANCNGKAPLCSRLDRGLETFQKAASRLFNHAVLQTLNLTHYVRNSSRALPHPGIETSLGL